MKYKSIQSTAKNLKTLFSGKPESDSITLEECYLAFNRDLSDELTNKRWISNLMTHLKYRNFIVPEYAVKNNKRVLSGIRLTLEGKKAIGRVQAEQSNNWPEIPGFDSYHANSSVIYPSKEKPVNVSDVMKMVSRLREENPDFDIVFDIKLRG